jgi:CBS domain-containing protein
VVVDEQHRGDVKPIGMLTDRDIVIGVLARSDRHLSSLTVGDVMSPGIVTAKEGESVFDALKRMRAFGIRRIPVVDDDGNLQGIITFDDVLELLQEQIGELASLLERERKCEADVRPHGP